MEKTIKDIVEQLNNGASILYPSDTIWGLGCDATNEEACQRLFQLKKRPVNKSFIVLVDGFPMLERFVPEFDPICYDLVDLAVRPLTIIYPTSRGLASSVVAKDGSVGIRITTDSFCLSLIRQFRKPIVSTSANLSGEPNPTHFDEISSHLKSNVDLILRSEIDLSNRKPSQIIKVGAKGQVQIIRN